MIATRLLTTAEGGAAYDAHICCVCRATLRFVRTGATTECVLPVDNAAEVASDDLLVWTALRVNQCGCRGRVDRWRFTPAIPEPTRVADSDLERRTTGWAELGHRHLAVWAVSTRSRWAATNAPTPLHALAWSMLGATNLNSVARFIAAGAVHVLDQLEFARAGVRSPATAAAWLDAGASDAHDAACRARAGERPSTIDTGRTGCHALAEAWPDTRPATTECARRLGIDAGPAIARLTVALPTGGAVELYESTHRGQAVLAAVTVDRAGREHGPGRIVVPHVRQSVAA